MKKIAQAALAVIALSFLCTSSLFAASQQVSDISWGFLIIGLFGGLAFFLYGMEKMSEGLKKSAGNQMRTTLAALTRNRIIGLFVGAFVTMVIQSSSATTVILVSFVQSGLMRFAQSMGVILGADIGTTVTAQLIAFKLTDYALLMAACGFAMRLLGKSEKVRDIGDVILGFGILFYGMKLMSDAMKPLRSFPEFIDILRELENPMLGIFVGTVFTAVIQSSGAFTGLVIVLARKEISNMARLVGRMLRTSIVPFMSDEKLISKEAETADEATMLVNEIPTQDEFHPELSLIEGIQMREDKINFLQAKIKEYLISISRLEISDAQSNEIYGMIGIVKDMESIGDLIHRNMLPLMQKKKALEIDFSEEGKEELLIYHGKACRQLQRLKEAFAERNLAKADKIMAKERKYLDLELKYRVHHLDRMKHERAESLQTHEVHLELMDLMKQIIVYSSNIAKTYLASMRKEEALGS